MALIQAVVLTRRLDEEERASSDRVEAVLRDASRASSAVEGMNGVLQVRQSRHRRMTRTMLDLTRLCWNCRPLRYSSRRKFCPYQALDLDLPTCDFWTLLHSNPDELTQTLSTA